MNVRFYLLLAGAAQAGMFCSTAAAAQAAPETTATTPDVTENGLADIVVTAQRRSESLQRTPLAVTALSPESLQDRNVQSSQGLQQVVPSLQISTQTAGDGPASATFFLRGLGQQRSGNGSQPAVGIYIDDFYYPSLEGTVFDILDVQQVEVLRGPQGTLFGRNTIGGAIRYTTKKPDFDFSGHATATLGSFGRHDFSGAINIPFGEVAALRLTAGSLDRDSFVRDQTTGKRDLGGSNSNLVRAQLRVEPATGVTIDLQGQYSKSRYDGFAYRLPGPFNRGQLSNIYNSIPPLSNPALGGTPYDARFQSTCFYCEAGGTRDSARVKSYVANGTVAVDLSPTLTLKSLTGFIQVKSQSISDLDGTRLPVFELDTSNDNRAFSQELQLSGRLFDDRVKFVAGGYFYHEKLDTGGVGGIGTVVVARPNGPTLTDRVTTTKAGYIDLTWSITDRLSAIGGFRYSSDHIRQNSRPAAGGSFNDSVTFNSALGRGGLQFQWTPDIMSYATFSQGFRAGGFNTLQNGSLQPFRPEKLNSYEAGSRFTLLDHRLRLNPTFFYTTWTNIQVQRVTFPPPTFQPQITLENAAKAHTYGFELEADAAVSNAFHLFGHLATLHMQYDSVGNATGITVDSRFQRAPKFSYGIGGTYKADLGSVGTLSGTVDYGWQARQASTPTDLDALTLKSYGVTNLRLEYRPRGEMFSIAGFVTNLFDERYFVGGVNYNETSPHYDLGRPREFGVTARVQF